MNHHLPDATRQMIEQGYRVVPINAQKRPLYKWRQTEWEPQTILDLLERPDAEGIAVITDGFVSRDFDLEGSYDKWKRDSREIARIAPTVKTGRKDGYHVWVKCPQVTRKVVLGDGQLTTGENLTICPPSLHANGTKYKWLNPLQNLRTLTLEELVGKETANRILSRETATPITSHCDRYSVARAIEQTLPTGAHQRHECLFKFARALKFECGMADASDDELRAVLIQWFDEALPHIRTKRFETSWREFRHAFNQAKYPLVCGAGLAAVQAAMAGDLPDIVKSLRGRAEKLFAGVCWHLSDGGKKPFFLSSHYAAKRAGVSQPVAWGHLRTLQKKGFIEQVKPGNRNTAATYIWKPERAITVAYDRGNQT